MVIVEPPCKKMKGASEPQVLVGAAGMGAKLEEIGKKLDSVCQQLSFIDDLKKVFECVICRAVAKAPIISTCCHRVIGCAECVEQWCRANSRCPLHVLSNWAHDGVLWPQRHRGYNQLIPSR